MSQDETTKRADTPVLRQLLVDYRNAEALGEQHMRINEIIAHFAAELVRAEQRGRLAAIDAYRETVGQLVREGLDRTRIAIGELDVCYEDALNGQKRQAVWRDEVLALVTPAAQATQGRGPTIDLWHESLKALRDAYVQAFGPLPPEMTSNYIDWEITEIIKRAAQGSGTQNEAVRCDIIDPLRGSNDKDVATGEPKQPNETTEAAMKEARRLSSHPEASPAQVVSADQRMGPIMSVLADVVIWSEEEQTKDRIRRAINLVQEAFDATMAAQPPVTVWEGEMPESSGKSNFTAMLTRKGVTGFDMFKDGFVIAQSEYPDRTRYAADCMRYLIGELPKKPEIWEKIYDFGKHSGYVEPDRADRGSDNDGSAATVRAATQQGEVSK